MAYRVFTLESRLPHPAEQVFAWHARPGALERLIPPWSRARIVARSGGVEDGSRVTLELPFGPRRLRWVAEHKGYVPSREFTDVQVEGPFTSWEHTHRVLPDGPNASVLSDTIRYRLPLSPVGPLVAGAYVDSELARTFAYRHRTTRLDLAAHASCTRASRAVAVTGASGLVGSVLLPFLRTGGHRVWEIGRSPIVGVPDCLRWNPDTRELDTTALEGVDAVVHLAGDNIAAGRWTRTRKQQILASRVEGTRFLSERLAMMQRPPRVLVSASAIGFYGDRGASVVTESDPAGVGFLADVCARWEAATAPAAAAGLRVVHLRIGVVLTPKGGALARMLTPFRLGAGGVLGSGDQFTSWIAIDDLARVIHQAILDETLCGPVNAVAPDAVTNRTFTRTLASVLKRPALVPAPAFVLRTVLGEMADELLLASTRVAPDKLERSSFSFAERDLESALRSCLGRPLKRTVG